MKRDAVQHTAGAHPVFSASEKVEKGNDKGDLVYDVRPALRYKSLPDLFAGSLPKKTAAPEEVPLPVPAAAPKKDKEPPKKIRKNGHCPSFVGLSTKEKSI